MAKKKQKQDKKKLSRMLAYVLGQHPDEFGLWPDTQGYIKIKDLLAALSEEEGWSFVRQAHLQEFVRASQGDTFEIAGNLIRLAPAESRLGLGPYPPGQPPTLLYFAARQKSYPAIFKHGLRPTDREFVPLCTTPELALRLAKRRDPKPILLTIQAAQALEAGVEFLACLERFFLVSGLEPRFFVNPPQPRPEEAPNKPAKPQRPSQAPTPGSFMLEPEHLAQEKWREKGNKKESWKRERKKREREKL